MLAARPYFLLKKRSLGISSEREGGWEKKVPTPTAASFNESPPGL